MRFFYRQLDWPEDNNKCDKVCTFVQCKPLVMVHLTAVIKCKLANPDKHKNALKKLTPYMD